MPVAAHEGEERAGAAEVAEVPEGRGGVAPARRRSCVVVSFWYNFGKILLTKSEEKQVEKQIRYRKIERK